MTDQHGRDVDGDGLDRAIDSVLGAMTAGEPDAAFRARVMARIDQGTARPRAIAWRVPSLVRAALAVGLVAVAWATWMMITPRSGGRSPEMPTLAAVRGFNRIAAGLPLAAPSGLVPLTRQIVNSRQVSSAVDREPQPVQPLEADATVGNEADLVFGLPALPDVEPIALAALEPTAIELPELELVPLAVEPLVPVDPLVMDPTVRSPARDR
jgi:hypothetical protein